jgi:GAF domain-containing protein
MNDESLKDQLEGLFSGLKDILDTVEQTEPSPEPAKKEDVQLLREQVQRLTILNQMATTLNVTATTDEIFKVAVRYINQIVSNDQIGIALWDEARETLKTFILEEEKGLLPLETAVSLEETAVGKAVQDKTLVSLPDLAREDFTDTRAVIKQGLRSALIAPMIAGHHVIGALSVSSKNLRAYSSFDEDIFSQSASFLASTIKNTFLIRQTQKALAETEVLCEASSDINAAQSYHDVLSVLCQYTMLGQNPKNVCIEYFDRPWTANQRPETVQVLACWVHLSAEMERTHYPLKELAGLVDLLRPDEPLIVEDINQDSRLDDNTRFLYSQHFEAESIIFLPMVVTGQWIGFVHAFYEDVTTFPAVDIQGMMALIGQAAVAVQSLYTLNQSKQQIQELAVINKILEEISRQLELGQVLDTVYQELKRVISMEAFFVALYDDQTRLVSYPLFYDQDSRIQTDPIPLPAQGNLRQVIETGEPLLANRTPEEIEAIVSGATGEMYKGHPGISVLFIPLRLGQRTNGAMSVQSYRFNAYTQRDLFLMSSIANHVAVAIENARLYEEAQIRARRERILREVTSQVRGSVDVDTVMRTAVQEVGRVLGRRTFVYLKDQQR